jgi:hypothetical protein
VHSALACKIVQLDRLKFNDAVASGLYPCAPATKPGSSRIFDEDGLIPLYFFARLTEFGVTTAVAGRIACDIASSARAKGAEKAERVVFVRGTDDVFPINSPNPEHEEKGIQYAGIGRVIFTVEFYVKHVRKIIGETLAYEASILGREDGE